MSISLIKQGPIQGVVVVSRNQLLQVVLAIDPPLCSGQYRVATLFITLYAS